MNTRDKGRFGEDAAVEYLKNSGYNIVSRNFIGRHGEIDIVAENGKLIIFAEVKSRSGSRPALAVSYKKQGRIVDTAKEYLLKHRTKLIPQIDIIEVFTTKQDDKMVVLKINHIKNAFGARG